jgi:bifunctional non-homologous end joining protein LigD
MCAAMLRPLRGLAGVLQPCLPSPAPCPPSGPGWLHEIKHDGFRLLARREGGRVRLYTRNGHDWAERFALIVEAVAALKVQSCLLDGEVIACDSDGLASFDLLRGRRHDGVAALCAFDLLELDGLDLCRTPLEDRKRALARLLRRSRPGIALNEAFAAPGDIVFRQACALGCEGIVSKRLGSHYRSGRSRDWIKSKNPAAPAVRREAMEDWGRRGRPRR